MCGAMSTCWKRTDITEFRVPAQFTDPTSYPDHIYMYSFFEITRLATYVAVNPSLKMAAMAVNGTNNLQLSSQDVPTPGKRFEDAGKVYFVARPGDAVKVGCTRNKNPCSRWRDHH